MPADVDDRVVSESVEIGAAPARCRQSAPATLYQQGICGGWATWCTSLCDRRTDPQELAKVCDDPAYADVRADLSGRLAELQQHYRDELYRGEGTPHPEWGPYDHEIMARIAAYVAQIDESA